MSKRLTRPRLRRTSMPPATSTARCSPRATARIRSTSVDDGGGGPSQRRTARRARARGAAISVLVRSRSSSRAAARSSAARPSKKSESSRATAAWRARTARRSRRAPDSRAGITSRRSHTRRWTGSAFIGSSSGASPRRAQMAARSARGAPSSGRATVPRRAGMPARPDNPAPRRTLSRTVSAWSSRVWPTSTAVAPSRTRARSSASYRASRARASKFGPGATATRSPAKPVPRCSANRATTPASAALPGRAPWSTWTATGASPASAASASSASESGPPEQATTTGGSSPAKSAVTLSAGQRADPLQPPLRRLQLGQGGEAVGPPPGGVERLDPHRLLEAGDELLADLVLAHLHLDADQLAEHPADVRSWPDVALPEAVHDHVAMPFQERHEGLDLVDDHPLLVGGEEGDDAAVVEGVPAPP